MTTAPAADQQRLLEVQALDTRAAQLAHKRRTLPVLADLAAVRARLADLEDDGARARTLVSDLTREVVKAEADVEQVRSRAARDRQRMDSGAGTAKDMQALAHELESLARRKEVLEEAELEAMERLETAESALAEVKERLEELSGKEAGLAAEAEAALAALDAETATLAVERQALADGLDAGLVTLYERVRAHTGGLGAAALRGTRCEGCRLELNATDLARIRATPADEVVRCEECGRILVRPTGGGSAG